MRLDQKMGAAATSTGKEYPRKIARYFAHPRKVVPYTFRCWPQIEAFMFGSVPLRTYLPDGDIDVSIFTRLSGPDDSLRDSWPNQLVRFLEREGSRRDAPFPIRNCQVIQAEVKLVKCVVANVVIDISFNALGGLCTVAFLEWADRTLGRGHIFKRSIVLVKAWCYYESRLLGAHHSLISSYALEAMVLYVFNLHGAALNTPLQVLVCFLRVFAAFEWDKYCLSMLGPIPLSSFPHPFGMPC
jgi:DNA polymerase sigma